MQKGCSKTLRLPDVFSGIIGKYGVEKHRFDQEGNPLVNLGGLIVVFPEKTEKTANSPLRPNKKGKKNNNTGCTG